MGFWNFASSLVDAGASVYGVKQNNKNIDKQLAAQQRENQAIREYNLNLAKKQNQWSIEQWIRENQYNTPTEQLKRTKAAGLNPDLLYGNGTLQNVAASSPTMTAGAAGTPMDWSPMAAKKTALDMALQRAQIENINADSEQKRSSANNLDVDSSLRQYFSDKQYEELEQRIAESKSREDANLSTTLNNNLEYGWKEKNFAAEYEILQNKLDMSRTEVQNFVRYWSLKIAGMELDNDLKSFEKTWNSPEILENLGEGAASLWKLLMMAFRK